MDADILNAELKNYFGCSFEFFHVYDDVYRIEYKANKVYGSLLNFFYAAAIDIVSIVFVNNRVKITVTL